MDRFGLRPCIAAAALIMCASALTRAFAVDHATLFLAVGLFGIGGPLVSIGCPKLVGVWFSPRQRGLAAGIYMTGPILGSIVALAGTNSVAMRMLDGDWRRVTLLYAGMTAIAGAAWLVVSGHRMSRAVDRDSIGEHRQAPLNTFIELLGNTTVQRVLLVGVGMFFFLHGMDGWLPEILRSRGMTPETAGYWASIPTAVGLGCALLIPRLATPGRSSSVLLGLCVSMVVAMILLQFDARPVLAAGLVCQGLPRGAMMTVCMLVLMEAREVGSRNIGAASGLFFSVGEVGGALGPFAIGWLADLTGDFTASLAMLALVSAVLILIAAPLRARE